MCSVHASYIPLWAPIWHKALLGMLVLSAPTSSVPGSYMLVCSKGGKSRGARDANLELALMSLRYFAPCRTSTCSTSFQTAYKRPAQRTWRPEQPVSKAACSREGGPGTHARTHGAGQGRTHRTTNLAARHAVRKLLLWQQCSSNACYQAVHAATSASAYATMPPVFHLVWPMS